jgi:hypothetical protein
MPGKKTLKKKKVRNVNSSKRHAKVAVGPKKDKPFGQETMIPKVKTPNKPFNKLAFDKGRRSHFGIK